MKHQDQDNNMMNDINILVETLFQNNIKKQSEWQYTPTIIFHYWLNNEEHVSILNIDIIDYEKYLTPEKTGKILPLYNIYLITSQQEINSIPDTLEQNNYICKTTDDVIILNDYIMQDYSNKDILYSQEILDWPHLSLEEIQETEDDWEEYFEAVYDDYDLN